MPLSREGGSKRNFGFKLFRRIEIEFHETESGSSVEAKLEFELTNRAIQKSGKDLPSDGIRTGTSLGQ